MVKRRKEDALVTRERILDAAILVFHERGVARPSLTDVAELAGVTRGAVYGHFRNKADLVTAMAARVRLPADALCEGGAETLCGDPLGELHCRWLALFEEVARNQQWQHIFAIILHRLELVTESGEIRDRVEAGHKEVLARMQEILELAVEARQIPADLDVATAASLLHSSLMGILQDWLLTPSAYDLAARGRCSLEALLDMLRCSPALRLKG